MERERSRSAEAQCPICLSNLGSEANIVLECRHAFHSTCLCIWFRRNPACPLCRSLPDESDGSESEDLGAAHRYALLPVRALTWAVAEPLRASRRSGADPALRRAATAFRRARGAVLETTRAARDHRASEPFRTLMREQRSLVDAELARRRSMGSSAAALMEAWGAQGTAPAASRRFSHA